ncbi:MAG: Mov34/MPN/PAD-1 family protein [Candidatus Altiarchaeota archaeon]|nr:Mov34/MPN/PAD-1 family protein [Candidatus Altiarchaeota archaeon]
MLIKKTALEFILGVSRSTHPKEFTALLRGSPDVIKEVLLIPGSLFGENFASIRFDMKPFDSTIVGSVHSHPSTSYEPSNADRGFFSKTGFIHLIVKYPYKSIKDVAAYDLQGNRVDLGVEGQL